MAATVGAAAAVLAFDDAGLAAAPVFDDFGTAAALEASALASAVDVRDVA